MKPKFSYIPAYLQSPSVSRWALTLPSHVVTGGSVLALAFLEASIAIGASFTAGLTAPASVARSADAGPSDGVTQRIILALASLSAVGTPVVTVASWGENKEKEIRFSVPCSITCTGQRLDMFDGSLKVIWLFFGTRPNIKIILEWITRIPVVSFFTSNISPSLWDASV